MSTRNVYNYNDVLIGTLTLPDETSEAEWAKQLALYRYQPPSNLLSDIIDKLDKTRFTIVCTFNGTVGNNNWLGYNELIPGNQVPIRIPVKCKLREIAFSYNQNNLLGIPLGSENVDGQFKLFKNGLTDPANVVHTEQFTNQAGGKCVTGLDILVYANDYIVGKWIDSGDNPSDMSIVYFFEVL